MASGSRSVSFGRYRIAEAGASLWKADRRLKITPKSLAVLRFLVQNAGRLVTHEEMLRAVWPGTHVSIGVLKTAVAEIRRVIDDPVDRPRFIQTEPGRGYRFKLAVGVGNLPVPLTSFVGRQLELSKVARLLSGGRLITLCGPGGVGKTRLAIRIGWSLMKQVRHGVFGVDLAPLGNASLVTPTVALALGVPERTGVRLVDAIATSLGDSHVLLLLDNCEHLLDACASLAEQLLAECPNLKILATSREPLGVAGETTWNLPPLALPDASTSAADLSACESVRLFVERARNVSPAFALTESNASAIRQICCGLDGLPLAIELAASRVNALTPEQIAAHVDDVVALPRLRSRTPPRHRTLKATFDWSYDLLSPSERELLASLSVFAGAFTLAAMDAVLGAAVGSRSPEMRDTLMRLIDRSFVTVMSEPSMADARYRLLSTIRQYARTKLAPGLDQTLARCHAEYFLGIAEETQPCINTAASASCLSRLEGYYDNLQAALEWSSQAEDDRGIGARLAVALWQYWLRRTRWGEGRRWLETMLARSAAAPVRTRAEALYGAGTLASLLGDYQQARVHLEESAALWRTTDDVAGLGRALRQLGSTLAGLGDLERGVRLLEESVNLLSDPMSAWDRGIALSTLGRVARLQGRSADASACQQTSAALLRAFPDPWSLVYPLRELGRLAADAHEYERAEAYWSESLSVVGASGQNWQLALIIQGQAEISFVRRDYSRAVRLFAAADALLENAEVPFFTAIDDAGARCIEKLRGALSGAVFSTLWDEGRKLSREQVLALASSAARRARRVGQTGHIVSRLHGAPDRAHR
jgi:non-specific serine/threonine protein kinase